MNEILKTVQNVQDCLKDGDFNQAVGVAKEILEHSPKDVFCLSLLAQSEFNQGNLDEAKSTIIKALEIQPDELNLNRNLAIIHNKQGDFKSSVQAYMQGIEHNRDHPGVLLDVMLMGVSLDRISSKLGARVIDFVFSRSLHLKNAYMNQNELPLIVDASNIANNIVRNERYKVQKSSIDELSLGFEDDKTKRLYDFLDSFHGIQAPKYADPMQRPTYHVFPDLEPVPFYDAAGFSWTPTLEENWQEIKTELDALYNDASNVKPYIAGIKTGVEGLDTLIDSLDWSSIHLIKGGEYQHELLEKCPNTKEVLKQLPLPVLDGNAPEVFLSVLKPGAEIKPHFGLSNIKLTVHLGLEIPENCAIRVGNETQTWESGKVTIFDDSFEHEAWNRSDKERKVLIIEVWHPDLSNLERQGIQKIMQLQHKASQLTLTDSIESLLSKINDIL